MKLLQILVVLNWEWTGDKVQDFLNAINDNPLLIPISVDIRDCSDVSDSKLWTFIKMDSSKS